jgi:DinB family protein
MDITPQSVSQPDGWQPNEYQRTLLERLAAQDPADVQADTPTAIRTLIAEAGEDLRTRPQETEWSVYQCIGHIVDAELVISGRYRWILAQDAPDILPYDQDMWADRFHGAQDEDVADMLDPFEALRRANVDLWDRTPESDRTRAGMHRERGPESYGLTFRLTAAHDLVHMDQARRTLEQVRASRQGG